MDWLFKQVKQFGTHSGIVGAKMQHGRRRGRKHRSRRHDIGKSVRHCGVFSGEIKIKEVYVVAKKVRFVK